MNKILLILIISSGFLLIYYANSDIFTTKIRKTFSWANYNRSSETEQNVDNVFFDYDDNFSLTSKDLNRIKYTPQINKTEYNIFIIYTKENFVLKNKFQLFIRSLLKYASVKLHLHIITENSEQAMETILRSLIEKYEKVSVFYTLYDVQDCANKISDIVQAMLPYFSSNPNSYYSDALFFLSLGLHKIVDSRMRRAILIDVDVVFRSDVKELFDEFHKFSPENMFGLSPELTPVYLHILYKYRTQNPKTNFGNPYIAHETTSPHKDGSNARHGFPGLNSGVVMLNFDQIRKSRLYASSLKPKNIERLVTKYSFKGHLGDQDFYTLIGYEFPSLIYKLDCRWNRQLCTWWKAHGYSDIFDTYFHCEGKIKLYHGNCNTRIPE